MGRDANSLRDHWPAPFRSDWSIRTSLGCFNETIIKLATLFRRSPDRLTTHMLQAWSSMQHLLNLVTFSPVHILAVLEEEGRVEGTENRQQSGSGSGSTGEYGSNDRLDSGYVG